MFQESFAGDPVNGLTPDDDADSEVIRELVSESHTAMVFGSKSRDEEFRKAKFACSLPACCLQYACRLFPGCLPAKYFAVCTQCACSLHAVIM